VRTPNGSYLAHQQKANFSNCSNLLAQGRHTKTIATTCSVDGEQFVAVPTGDNGGSPEVRPVTLLAFERNRPYSRHAVYVFALPKKAE
jgi:hypothetical protein